MADGPSREREASGASRLWWWICFSGALHILIIVTLLLVPPSRARRRIPYSVYTVDLVDGGGLDGELSRIPTSEPKSLTPADLSKETPPAPESVEELTVEPEEIDDPVAALPAPEPPKPEPVEEMLQPVTKEPEKVAEPEFVALKKPEQEKPSKEVEKKEVEKKPDKKIETAEKKKEVKKQKPKAKKVVKKKPTPVPRKVENKKTQRDEIARQRLREKRIQAAVAKAKERAARRKRSSATNRRESSAQVARAGGGVDRVSGRGVGDGTGGGGGVVKGLEFLVYRNRMLNRIKSRWAWVGKRNDLEVTVRFGVDVDGQIFALEIMAASGDASYDDSVVRAVKRASPLPPPPASYLHDFSDVELTFRPRDLNE